MRRRIRDHTPDDDAQPFGVFVRDPGDGLQAIRDVLPKVVAVIVDGDLRIVEQRRQRSAAEQIVELLLRDHHRETSWGRPCLGQSCREQEVRQGRLAETQLSAPPRRERRLRDTLQPRHLRKFEPGPRHAASFTEEGTTTPSSWIRDGWWPPAQYGQACFARGRPSESCHS